MTTGRYVTSLIGNCPTLRWFLAGVGDKCVGSKLFVFHGMRSKRPSPFSLWHQACKVAGKNQVRGLSGDRQPKGFQQQGLSHEIE